MRSLHSLDRVSPSSRNPRVLVNCTAVIALSSPSKAVHTHRSSFPPMIVSHRTTSARSRYRRFIPSYPKLRMKPLRLLSGDSCLAHPFWMTCNLIVRSRNDATSGRKLGPDTHEIGINFTSCLTAFVDAPVTN